MPGDVFFPPILIFRDGKFYATRSDDLTRRIERSSPRAFKRTTRTVAVWRGKTGGGEKMGPTTHLFFLCER